MKDVLWNKEKETYYSKKRLTATFHKIIAS